MRSFILRDLAGKGLGVIEAVDEASALSAGQANDWRVAAAHPDNPARLNLSAMLAASGLSNREFARRVLGRDVRSLARYLSGDIMPPELADQVLRMSVSVSKETIHITVRR
ncbi:MAG: hypothetical protein K2Y26_17935 [Gemmatimonadaceae bacterium]|nr:hypothetical protein [Gemmatimonadaceae bacterium]